MAKTYVIDFVDMSVPCQPIIGNIWEPKKDQDQYWYCKKYATNPQNLLKKQAFSYRVQNFYVQCTKNEVYLSHNGNNNQRTSK